MLETIAIILIVLWLLGLVSGYTMGNFIWLLLVIAVVLFLVRLRSRMGLLKGVARVDGQAVIDGTMTFALGPPQEPQGSPAT